MNVGDHTAEGDVRSPARTRLGRPGAAHPAGRFVSDASAAERLSG